MIQFRAWLRPWLLATMPTALMLCAFVLYSGDVFARPSLELVQKPTTPVSSPRREENTWPNMSDNRGLGVAPARARIPWPWEDVFAFVPNGISSCRELEPVRFPDDFVRDYETFVREVKKYRVSHDKGSSALYLEEYHTYYRLVSAPFVKTVCETGFNAGHSAFLWLSAKPDIHLYSFDIGKMEFAKPMADYLMAKFTGRFNITWGNSMKTLPAFRMKYPDVKCDLIVIDGGHTEAACQSDYDNFQKMAATDNIVLLDNYPDNRRNGAWIAELGKVWESAKRRGEILEVFHCNYWPKDPQGFSVGRFNF